MAMITGRIASDESGNVYYLTFQVTTPPIGFAVVKATGTIPADAQVTDAAPAPAVSLGEPQTVPDGTPLPAGIWEVEGGSVYAGYGGATIRQVVFGNG